MGTPIIRIAEPQDLDAVVDLCGQHAAFEESTYNRDGKRARLDKHLFADSPSLHCLVIQLGDSLIGYATYMTQFSTWDAEHYLYMDCLFLCKASRGFGLGRQLMDRIQGEARSMGIAQIQWQTPAFNEGAIAFYEKIGATSLSKERFFLGAEPVEHDRPQSAS